MKSIDDTQKREQLLKRLTLKAKAIRNLNTPELFGLPTIKTENDIRFTFEALGIEYYDIEIYIINKVLNEGRRRIVVDWYTNGIELLSAKILFLSCIHFIVYNPLILSRDDCNAIKSEIISIFKKCNNIEERFMLNKHILDIWMAGQLKISDYYSFDQYIGRHGNFLIADLPITLDKEECNSMWNAINSVCSSSEYPYTILFTDNYKIDGICEKMVKDHDYELIKQF